MMRMFCGHVDLCSRSILNCMEYPPILSFPDKSPSPTCSKNPHNQHSVTPSFRVSEKAASKTDCIHIHSWLCNFLSMLFNYTNTHDTEPSLKSNVVFHLVAVFFRSSPDASFTQL